MTAPTKPILVAGLLGGVLGGVGSLGVTRWMKPATPAKTEVGGPAEAKQIAESYIGKLKEGKYEEFKADVKAGLDFTSEAVSQAYNKDFDEARRVYPGASGSPTGEFDLLRETALAPDLARFVYLEKFQRGSLLWIIVVYRTPERWRINAIAWKPELILAFPDKP